MELGDGAQVLGVLVHVSWFMLLPEFSSDFTACTFWVDGDLGVLPAQPMPAAHQRKGLGPNPTGAAGEKQEGFWHSLGASRPGFLLPTCTLEI